MLLYADKILIFMIRYTKYNPQYALFRRFSYRNVDRFLVLFIYSLFFGSSYSCVLPKKSNLVKNKMEKYHEATQKFQQKKYWKSLVALEELLPDYAQHPFMQSFEYYFGLNLFFCKKYRDAIFFLDKFVKNYPKDKKIAEILYYQGLAYYHLSLKHELDQSDTHKALYFFKHYCKKYPKSNHISTVEKKINELEQKMTQKMLKKIEFYYKQDHYHVAKALHKNFLKKYSNSNFQEKLLFFLIENSYKKEKKMHECVNFNYLQHYYYIYQELFSRHQHQYKVIYYMFDAFYRHKRKLDSYSSKTCRCKSLINNFEFLLLKNNFTAKKNSIKPEEKNKKNIKKIQKIIEKLNAYEKKSQ